MLSAEASTLGAAVHLAQAIPIGNAHIVIESGVGPLVHEGSDRVNLDPGVIEWNEKHSDTLVFRRIGICTRDEQHVAGKVGARSEHLLAVDDPIVTIAHGRVFAANTSDPPDGSV